MNIIVDRTVDSIQRDAMVMSLSICLLVCLWVSEGRLLATYGTQNTSRTATMRTATYRHGNTSFSIVGPLHFVDGSDPSALGTEIAGKIIVADGDAYGNSFAWARACQSHECVGVVMVTTVMGAVASLEAWLETDRTGYSSTERSPIPVATLDGTDALVSMDDVRGRPGPVIAMLDSCDIVDGTSASLLFAAPGATAAFVIAWLVNIVNMVAAIYKLLAFAIGWLYMCLQRSASALMPGAVAVVQIGKATCGPCRPCPASCSLRR